LNDFVSAIVNFFLMGSGRSGLRPGDPGVEFSFARPLPAWGWLLVLVGAVVLAGWSYRRQVGARWARSTLAGVRAGVLVALVLVVSGPQLVRPNDRVERDWVLVLVDRSASMTIPDAPGADGQGRETRDEQLARALERSRPMWSALAADRDVVWMGFDRGAFDLQPGMDGVAELGEPAGRGTSLGAALEQALRRAAARPVSGVVILSDGRSADEPGRAALRRLQAEHIPVVTVPLGSAEPVTDLAVESVAAPVMAFLNDLVPVQVRIERLGGDAEGASGGAVELVDKTTGIVLDRQVVDMQGDSAVVVLKARPEAAGRAAWVVRLTPDGPDLIAGNNSGEAVLELVDRPLRVVYFDGYPRWEYRYIKNLLVREKSIASSALLLAANRRSVQEGGVILGALPRTAEEWARFDVVMIGDVRPEMFSREQLEQLKEHVAVRGGGLLWIGGPGATPAAWGDTPLGELLPFRLASAQTGEAMVRAWTEPVTMTRTELAARLGVLELADPAAAAGGAEDDAGWPSRLSDPATGWSKLRWAQRIEPEAVKPTAEVLATVNPVSAPEGSAGATPAVLSMRYGAGRVLYVGTDEIWRWRYARGEALPERFWLPLIRMQGRESLARSARPAMLEVAPRRALIEQPVRIALRLMDQSLVDQRLPSVTVRIARTGEGAEDTQPIQVRLALEDGGSSRNTQTYSTTWLPTEPGSFAVSVIEPTLVSMGLSAPVEVAYPDDEMRRPRTDHALLAALSADTGGAVVDAEMLSSLPGLLPKRDLRIAGIPDVETLWDRPMVLAVLLGLLTVEWVGRKLLQLA
jgi:hypothetical protein